VDVPFVPLTIDVDPLRENLAKYVRK